MKHGLEQALEQKSRELKSTINEQVEEGFVELESMSKKLDAASVEARSNLEKALNSEQVKELKTFLASIDEDEPPLHLLVSDYNKWLGAEISV